MRDGLLNGEIFRTLTEARVVNNVWLDQNNNLHPRCELGMRAPAAFAAEAIAELKEREREGVALGTNDIESGPRGGGRSNETRAGNQPSSQIKQSLTRRGDSKVLLNQILL